VVIVVLVVMIVVLVVMIVVLVVMIVVLVVMIVVLVVMVVVLVMIVVTFLTLSGILVRDTLLMLPAARNTILPPVASCGPLGATMLLSGLGVLAPDFVLLAAPVWLLLLAPGPVLSNVALLVLVAAADSVLGAEAGLGPLGAAVILFALGVLAGDFIVLAFGLVIVLAGFSDSNWRCNGLCEGLTESGGSEGEDKEMVSWAEDVYDGVF